MKYQYNEYIGIPWQSRGRDIATGLDCWGVVWHVYKHVYGIDIPKLSHIDSEDGHPNTADEIYKQYDIIHRQLYKVEQAQEGDIIWIASAGYPTHAGVCIDPRRMLHSGRRFNCVVEDFNKIIWRNRISGIYRHEDFIE